MQVVTDLDELESLYDAVNPRAVTKVADHLTPLYRRWIKASRFTVLSTVGLEGTDASPRGDNGPVVRIASNTTLWLPDWRGNNRLDSLRNIVSDGRVSLMFMVPGSDTVVRVNGTAVLTADASVTETFETDGQRPRSVIVVTIGEIYFQCAKALMRSALWSAAAPPADLPSAGDFLKEMAADFDAQAYDDGYAEYAKDRMW